MAGVGVVSVSVQPIGDELPGPRDVFDMRGFLVWSID